MKRRIPPLLECLESRINLSANFLDAAATPLVADRPGILHQPVEVIPHQIGIQRQLGDPQQVSLDLQTAPGGLTATVLSNSQIKLTWNNAAGETGYYLERSSDGVNWTQIYSNAVIGDANHSGTVDGADFDVWMSQMETTPTGWVNADFNGDGKVDGGDFDIWFTHLGATFSASSDVFTDSSLQAGTSYSYRIRAATATGLTSYSTVVAASTLPNAGNGVTVSTRFGNELVVAGTSANDSVVVSQSGSTLTIVADGQTYTQAAPAAGLFIYGYGGNDNITVNSSVTLRTTIESIAGTTDTITSNGTDVTAWIDSTDSYTGTGTVHRVASYYEGMTKAVGASLPEPTDSGTLNRVSQTLWGTGPQITDINQGQVGDCYFLSTLASIAYSSPNTIRETAVDMGDGTYTVQFVRNGVTSFVRVDDQFPAGFFPPGLIEAHPGASGAMWGAVIEKAYAFFRTGANTYASLNSGWMNAAYSDLGVANASLAIGTNEMAFYNTVTQKLAAGKGVTLGCDNGGGVVVSNHAYTVVGTSIDGSGHTLYTLRNPWGSSGGSAENAAGYATLTYAQLQLYYPWGGAMMA